MKQTKKTNTMKRSILANKCVFTLLLAFFLGMGTVHAYDFSTVYSGNTLYFNIIDATNHYVELTSGDYYPSGNLVLPSSVTHDGIVYTVTEIRSYAYNGYDQITSLTIPNSVTTIGSYAFFNCTGITGSLNIPNSVTKIDDHAFCNCTGFTGTLTIPTSMNWIGDAAFANCSFSKVQYNAADCYALHSAYTAHPFENVGGTLVIGNTVQHIRNYMFMNANFTGTLTIPSSVESIGSYAFYECTGFYGDLTIPNSVTTIGSCAFNSCTGFHGNLTITNGVTTIQSYAFGNCSGFTGTLTIPSSVTDIGNGAFYNCSSFYQVRYGALNCADVTESAHPFYGCGGALVITLNTQRVPANMFRNANFTVVTIREYVTSIGAHAFKDCSNLTNVYYLATNCADVTADDLPFEGCGGTLEIQEDVEEVPACLFRETAFTHVNYNVTNNTAAYIDANHSPFYEASGTLTIGENVQIIPDYMFSYADFTGTLTIPNSVTSIGALAFCGCDGFTGTLTLGSSVTNIGNYAFYHCSGFTGSLTIPSLVTSIGQYAFCGCTGFNGTLTIPNSVKWINNLAFYGTGFTGTLTIPNSVIRIGGMAFENCIDFTSLSIGSSVTNIQTRAFYGCTNLASMTVLPENPPTLGENAFYDVPKTIPVIVPCGSIEDYQAASGWNEFTNITCMRTVTVKAVAFYNNISTGGGTVTGGGTYPDGTTVIVTATPYSNYLFLHWSKNGEVVSCNPSYSFNVFEDTDLEAVFMAESYAGPIIGEGTEESPLLPSYSFYNYSLTEQIYTSDELGGSTTITSISFFNTGDTKTRTYDIYMKHTSKTNFDSTTDWISATSSNKVYSGSVTMRTGLWTTIVLDTPFEYNGTSNLVLVVDDNTGNYSSQPDMSCRTYATSGYQAIRIYSDDTNYNPSSPSSYEGLRMKKKNQIMLNRSVCSITATSSNTTAGTVSGGGQYGKGDYCRLTATPNTGYMFMDWTDDSGVVVSTDANYSFTVFQDRTLTANFLPIGDYCSLTFNLHDSYGDAWNDNYLEVDFGNGFVQRLAVLVGYDATFTLPVKNGSYVKLNWITGSYTEECSFEVNYSNGNELCSSQWFDFDDGFAFVMDCEGMLNSIVYIGDHGTTSNVYIPSHSHYNYSLTQQIYTADEIGQAGMIYSIAFYNQVTETKTRTYDIYLKHTTKTSFSNSTDWISAYESDKVFSGSVEMVFGKWTYITFDTPFDYDGTSNLALIVDDNTGSYTNQPHMACRVFDADGNQALRIYSDGTNYNPASPSSYKGTLLTVKNQIMLGFASTCPAPSDLTVANVTSNSASLQWTGYYDFYHVRYRTAPDGTWIETSAGADDFEDGLGNWTLIDADGDGNNWVLSNGSTNTSPHSGGGMVYSYSWKNNVVLYPDNYLVSPQVVLGNSVTFWACAMDPVYPAEHFGIAVSTDSNTNASDFTTIQEWTMTAKGERHGVPRGTRSQGSWYQYTVDLSAYAGQDGYIALRHFNCSDQYILCVDDFTYGETGTTPNSITLGGLDAGTTYQVQVRGICPNGLTPWSEMATFTTEGPSTTTQTVTLSAGTNWFSSNLEITLDDLKAALVDALPGTTNIVIKSKTQNVKYNGSSWRGNLTWDLSKMYLITVESACEITLEGMPINPADHPATILAGQSNWIAFPVNEEMTLSAAFAGFNAVNGDVVKSKTGNAKYNGSTWRATGLNKLEPGKGYLFNSASSQTRTLTFPTSSK